MASGVKPLNRIFARQPEKDTPDQAFPEQKDQSQGHVEHRRCWVINDIATDSNAGDWKEKTIAAVQLDS